MTITERPNVCYGDHDVAADNEILRTTVGSGVHGIAVPGTDDNDEMGIFIEPPDYVLGVRAPLPLGSDSHEAHRNGPYDDHTCRTVADGVRSGPGDTDLTVYSLRKWMRLALHGNPTVLLPLFATADTLIITDLGKELRDLTPNILSRAAGERFLGYLDGQRERMLGGGRQSKVPKRPELVEQYGFDVKYASHALRLAIQGAELMRTGHLTLPLPADLRRLILDLKTGRYVFREALAMIDVYRTDLVRLLDLDASPLPAEPDYAAVSDWMRDAHLGWWTENALT